jgi:UDP-N-acetyl-2-amino-2-deoxyglucuronate dehydrogenase
MPEKSHNFALIGVAGYIAVRHLQAIKETGHRLLATLDPFDSVGCIDSYFPEADFFVEFERFDRHIDKLKRVGTKIDYVSICSPNYLHDSHIRFALRQGADAICEKPLVLNPWNLDALAEIEKETGKRIYNILQLRLHPSIIALKKKIREGPKDKVYDIDLSYITSRGNWYHRSWKGDIQKSGGVATNIGIHFFDMLTWIFGRVQENIVHISDSRRTAGFMRLEKARVRWLLSINHNDLPAGIREAGQRTFRAIYIDNENIEFSEGFAELHTQTYKNILDGTGFGLGEARQSIETVYKIRNSDAIGLKGEYHPLLREINKRPV